MKLWKTTIIIWSEYDPSETEMELDEIAEQAIDGNMYCSSIDTREVETKRDKDWDGTEFFSMGEEEELDIVI